MKVVSAICSEAMLHELLARDVDLIAVLVETTQERRVWTYSKSDPDIFHDAIAWRVLYRVAEDRAAEDL